MSKVKTNLIMFALVVFCMLICIGRMSYAWSGNISVRPMPYEYLAEFDNPEFADTWTINYRRHDSTDPTENIWLLIHYTHAGQKLVSIGMIGEFENSKDIYVTINDVEPFLDFVNFLDEHNDVFFNHSEFEDDESDQQVLSNCRGVECFEFTVHPYEFYITSIDIYAPFGIKKCIDPESETPEEIYTAIEMIKTTMVDEILELAFAEDQETDSVEIDEAE